MNLNEALKQALSDDDKVSKFEAKVLRELILSDNRISEEERTTLEKALQANKFDKEAFDLLSELLMRNDLNKVK